MSFFKSVPGKQINRHMVIALQIKHVFEKIAPKEPITKVLNQGVILNQWVYKLEIQALSREEKVMGRFVIGIDWAAFLTNKAIFGPKVLVADDKTEKQDHAIWNVIEATGLFRSFIKKGGFKIRWLVYTSEGLNDLTTYKKLGVSRTKELKWAKGVKKILYNDSPKNLTEMSLLVEALEAG